MSSDHYWHFFILKNTYKWHAHTIENALFGTIQGIGVN